MQNELVPASRVADESDRLAVGRPRRESLGYALSSRQFANVAFAGRNGEDVPARLDDNALTAWRDARGPNSAGEILELGSNLGEVGRYGDYDPLARLRFRIEQVN